MTRTYYAIELRLWRVTADVDDDGIRIVNTEPTKQQIHAHYDGTLSDSDAQAKYAAADAILRGPNE